MKTKFLTKIASFAFVFVMCLLVFAGCGTALKLPNTQDAVTGNGGVAVQKGEYLYFVNGYLKSDDLKQENVLGSQKYSAIYRTTVADGELEYDDDGNLKNCELVVDKACGYDKTKLYIFGDYIYFASPNTNKVQKSGSDTVEYDFGYTDFCRAKLDGSDFAVIYKDQNSSSNMQYAFYKVNGVDDVYLSLFDGTKLIFVNCSTKKAETICKNASSVAMPAVADYNAKNNQISVGASNVYYTRSVNEDEELSSGNVLCYATIGKNKEVVLSSGNYTYSAISANNDVLVISRKGSADVNTASYAIKYRYSDGNVVMDAQNDGVKLMHNEVKNAMFLCTYEEGNFAGIITTNSSKKLVYVNLQKTNSYDVLSDTELTPLAVSGNFVYAYDSDNSLYQINYKNKATKKLVDMTLSTDDNPLNKPYFDAKHNITIIGTNAYYFATYTGDEKTGYYLNRVSTTDRDTYTSQVVADVQKDHIKTKKEDK